MGDLTTIANLTFLGTLGVAFVMFLGLFAVFGATLVFAGIGRLTVFIVMATAGVLSRPAGARTKTTRPALPANTASLANAGRPASARQPASSAKSSKLPKPARSARKEAPQLSPEWAAAVARADARAAARSRAEAAPAVKVSVRDLPSPTAPARDITKVAPLVESATDRNGELHTVPRAFKKPPMPAAKSLLDTGSLVSLGRLPLGTDKRPVQERKAG
ncbi:hypothetical protein [Arthrobacter sp. UYEF20]|uniref:hypothetical protein n=1 Tax=Arthrobacter sp. UYEF20 TaxID=1756363 RepID=UPI0033931879